MSAQLSTIAFSVLSSLASGRRHGYEIIRETERDSGGALSLKVPTLYATLERLEREGLVRHDGDEIVGGRARRYFALTDAGGHALETDTALRETQARLARARLAARPVTGWAFA